MNYIDEIVEIITNKTRSMYQDSACVWQEEKYKEILRGVFKLYDSCKNILPNTRPVTKEANVAFRELIYPFLYYAKSIGEVNSAYITKEAMEDLEFILLEKLSELSSQAFYFEFSKINNDNYHESAVDYKYKKFVADLLEYKWRAFFLEYPVLAMLMAAQIMQWTAMIKNFTEALHRDYSEIKEKIFLNDDKGSIVSIKAADNNCLNPLKSNLFLTFQKDYRLFYKARNIDTEIGFYNFLDWIETECGSLPIKGIRMIAGDNYGWMECVPQIACLSEEEVKRYYIRAGILLGLLYAFGSSDMHCLNLIANGENPVLIDLEALTGRSIETDVRSTFFLPTHYIIADGSPLYGNALGAETYTRTVHTEIKWNNVNTDRMVYVKRYREVAPPSVVFMHDKRIYSYNYQMQVLEGFESIYKYIMNHKRFVIDSTYKYFKGSSVRLYPRMCQRYSYIIKNSILPQHLKSGENRLAVIMKGLDSHLTIDPNIPEEIKHYEMIQLMVNALPKFYFDYIEGTIKEPRDVNIYDYCPEAPIDILKARISRFSKQDLEEQKNLIRESFSNYKANIIKHEMRSFNV